MAALEEEGWIIQPYTSAGRVPTEKAYKQYITEIVETPVPKKESDLMTAAVPRDETHAKQLAKQLAQMTGLAVVWAFEKDNVYYTGVSNLMADPEFNVSSIIDNIDDIVRDIFESVEFTPQVLIGRSSPFGDFSGTSDDEILAILASLESKSEHPIAHAIATSAKAKALPLREVEHFEIIKGKGLKGKIDGTEYFAGNVTLLKDLQLDMDSSQLESDTKEGKTPVILMTSTQVIAAVLVADAIKPEAAEAVKNLHRLGITTVMLTGDNENTAAYIAKQVGIDQVFAQVLPEDKLKKIKELQSDGKVVAMAGDGVNDAPALAQADVGIAMATGTDVAIESAGITLLHGDISKLVKAIKLSKMTMAGIKQNLFFAFIYNIVGIPLAGGLFYPILGWLLSPVFAGLAMALSSVSVVGNALRLKAKKL
jgi:cation transport ATPase